MGAVAEIREAVQRALEKHGYFGSEDGRRRGTEKIDLHTALIEQLSPDCERELTAEFHSALLPPPQPPESFKAKDVCSTKGRSRFVDLLWPSSHGPVAIEAKLRHIANWKGTYEDGSQIVNRSSADTYGYEFLKDIHRLERLQAVFSRSGPVTPSVRIALFLSNDPYEFEGHIPHANLRLSRRSLSPGHLVQFNLTKAGGEPTSPNTLWRDYPPFRLAASYQIAWEDLGDDVSRFKAQVGSPPYPTSRLLLVEVEQQDLPV